MFFAYEIIKNYLLYFPYACYTNCSFADYFRISDHREYKIYDGSVRLNGAGNQNGERCNGKADARI